MKIKVIAVLAVTAVATCLLPVSVVGTSADTDPNRPTTDMELIAPAWEPTVPPWQWPDPEINQGTSSLSTKATAGQSMGVVIINTIDEFSQSTAAGTGMVIDSNGIVVTNHHVVKGSTAVKVMVPSTNQTYSAEVLGYDNSADVAVLSLTGAWNLVSVVTDTSGVRVGDDVTAVGNADGAGQIVAVTGEITATGRSITVDNNDGTTSSLSDLIQMNAAIVPGDSGGAVLDDDGEVIGMNVAGSTSNRTTTTFAIPITTVLDVAQDVLDGNDTKNITLGRTAALGIHVSGQTQDIYVISVVPGGPAETTGITVGSWIIEIDGTTLTNTSELSTILAQHNPGDQIKIKWIDSYDLTYTSILTLTQAPLL